MAIWTAVDTTMDNILRWLASWKDIVVEPGTELQFEFLSFPRGGMGLLVILGILAALLAVIMIYRRDGKNLSAGQRFILGVLRVGAILMAAALLLEPSLVAVKKETRPGRTILLLDLSQSMTHVDAFRRDDVGDLAAAWRSLQIEDPAGVDRLALAKAILGDDNQALVRKLGTKNEVKLYGFSSGIEPLPIVGGTERSPDAGAEDPEGAGDPEGVEGEPAVAGGPEDAPKPADTVGGALPEPPVLQLDQINATGRYSNLGGAVRAALDRSRGSEVAGIVILTDGRRNAGPQGAEIARILGQRKVPVTLVLGVGDPSETQTVSVSRVEAPEKVFQRDPFELKANISSQGYESMSVGVRLLRRNEQGVEQSVDSQQVVVGGAAPEAQVTFAKLTSEETGPFTYRVEIDPPDGEPGVPERHHKSQRIEVLEEQTRVLLVSGGPSFEYRILFNQLIRDKTIEVSCWLQSADEDFPQDGDEGVVIESLPEEQADLEPYDVIIFLDPNPAKLTRTWSEMVTKHILENGCGLWWVCSEMYSLEAMRPGSSTEPLIDLLPVVPDVDQADRWFSFGLGFPNPLSYRVTPEGSEGLGAKITRIKDNKDEAKLLWGRLPGFHLAFPVKRLKPAATSLVENTSSDFRMADGRQQPVIATHFVGAARVLFSGVDETYRWRSIDLDAYDRLWVKGIRYLFEGRLNAGNSKFKLLLGDEKIELGESIKIVADAKNDAFGPLMVESIEVVIARQDRDVETIALLPVDEAPGQYEAIWRPTETGFYQVINPTHKDTAATFQVVPASIEKEGPVDLGELASLTTVERGGQARHHDHVRPGQQLGGVDLDEAGVHLVIEADLAGVGVEVAAEENGRQRVRRFVAPLHRFPNFREVAVDDQDALSRRPAAGGA